MTHLTVRNLPPEVGQALEEEKHRQGRSLNRTVIGLLARALGVTPGRRYDNGLGRLAGTWSEAELAEFEQATAGFSQIDEELWQ